MSITLSEYAVEAHTQADGRAWVHEAHTDNAGLRWLFSYRVAPGANYAAILAARAADLDEWLKERELERFIDGEPFLLVYQTKTQLAARFRAAYRSANKERLARLAYWLIERINDGTFTDAQVQAAFGLTTVQYNALKSRATALHDSEALIRAAQGE